MSVENLTGNLPNKVQGSYQRPLPRDFEDASIGQHAWKNEATTYAWDVLATLKAGIFCDLANAPITEADGVIYIGNGDTTSVHANWDTASQYDWLRFTADTSLWGNITPIEGQDCFDTSADTWYTFNGTSWIADISEGTSLSTKIVNLGDWNMDTTSALSVAHGLSATEWLTIKTVNVVIRNDTDSTNSPLNRGNASGVLDGSIATFDSTNINLLRTTGGNFDNTSYDATSYNRGFITITYTKD